MVELMRPEVILVAFFFFHQNNTSHIAHPVHAYATTCELQAELALPGFKSCVREPGLLRTMPLPPPLRSVHPSHSHLLKQGGFRRW